jgi:catechol 2,3-dioxygenase-like lactoylglutathione lyase family enzyme
MLAERLGQLGYVILLCDDLERMKAFYRDLLAFPVVLETATGLTMQSNSVFLGLRKRTRHYDGRTDTSSSPSVQLAFSVAPEEIDAFHQQLVAQGVKIFDPPCNQPWGHRTVYFADPEGNLLEIYGELI